MGWDKLAGTGVATAQKFVQRPTPFLTRHSASRLGGVPPMNKLPHDHVHIDEYTQTGATLLLKKQNKNCNGDHQESLTNICPIKTWYLGKSRKLPGQQTHTYEPSVWGNQGHHKSLTASGCLRRENRVQRQEQYEAGRGSRFI